MAHLRIGRPTFLADSGLSALFGAAGGLLVAVVVALTGFPEWGETLLSFLVVLSIFFVAGLAVRAGLHLLYEYVNHGMDASEDLPRSAYLAYTRPLLRFGAGSAGASAVLSLAHWVGTGEPLPG